MAFCPLHQADHAIEEAFARIRGDPHVEPVRENSCSAGYAAAVTTAFADHRGAFAGDRAFIDGGRAADHLAVARNLIASFDEHNVPLAQIRRRDEGSLAILHQILQIGLQCKIGHFFQHLFGGHILAGGFEGVRLRFAASFGHGFSKIGRQDREPEPKAHSGHEPRRLSTPGVQSLQE